MYLTIVHWRDVGVVTLGTILDDAVRPFLSWPLVMDNDLVLVGAGKAGGVPGERGWGGSQRD